MRMEIDLNRVKVGFGINGIEPSGSAVTVLANLNTEGNYMNENYLSFNTLLLGSSRRNMG